MHFAEQAQGFAKVTRWCRRYIGVCNFRLVFSRCWIALWHWDLHWQGCFKSSVLFWRKRVRVTLGEVTIFDVFRKVSKITFGESLVENARFGSLDCRFWWTWMVAFGESRAVSSKRVKQQCPDKSVKQECSARVSSQECPSRKSIKQRCPARVCSKSAL